MKENQFFQTIFKLKVKYLIKYMASKNKKKKQKFQNALVMGDS